jgi:hypothetical protein
LVISYLGCAQNVACLHKLAGALRLLRAMVRLPYGVHSSRAVSSLRSLVTVSDKRPTSCGFIRNALAVHATDPLDVTKSGVVVMFDANGYKRLNAT